MKNLLAVRVDPWQLFRFKKFCKYSGKRPSVAIQEALQIYFSTLPRGTMTQWLHEYGCLTREELKKTKDSEGVK